MRHFLIILLGLLLLVSCGGDNNALRLHGEIKGLKKGTVLLQKMEDTSLISLDSIRIDGNSYFEFTHSLSEPEVFYLTMRFDDSIRTEKRIPFFAEASEMKVTSTLEDFELESKVSGSANQELWNDYQVLMGRYRDRNLELIENQLNALRENKDSLANVYASQQQRLRSTQYLATINFAKNHNDMELAPFLMLSEVYDANLKYHDTIYKLLTPKIKDSKYGKALESFIQERRIDSL